MTKETLLSLWRSYHADRGKHERRTFSKFVDCEPGDPLHDVSSMAVRF